MLVPFLETRTCLCDDAEDGEVAVNIMKAILENLSLQTSDKSYDAIFMDYMISKMNGPDAKEISRLGYRGPTIGLTGNVLPNDKSLLMNAGCKQVLTKPARAKY